MYKEEVHWTLDSSDWMVLMAWHQYPGEDPLAASQPGGEVEREPVSCRR